MKDGQMRDCGILTYFMKYRSGLEEIGYLRE